jgi:hypothetical protein
MQSHSCSATNRPKASIQHAIVYLAEAAIPTRRYPKRAARILTRTDTAKMTRHAKDKWGSLGSNNDPLASKVCVELVHPFSERISSNLAKPWPL